MSVVYPSTWHSIRRRRREQAQRLLDQVQALSEELRRARLSVAADLVAAASIAVLDAANNDEHLFP